LIHLYADDTILYAGTDIALGSPQTWLPLTNTKTSYGVLQ
jgi:hypothetical protein